MLSIFCIVVFIFGRLTIKPFLFPLSSPPLRRYNVLFPLCLDVLFFLSIMCSIYVMLVFFMIDCASIILYRYYLMEKAKDANIVGILVGTLGVGMLL